MTTAETLQVFIQAASLVTVVIGVVRFLREREVEHASMISAWLDVHDFDGESCVRLLTRNDSRSYATSFEALITDIHGESPSREVKIPGLRPTGEQYATVLPVPAPDDLSKEKYALVYEFTDVRGRRWRHEQGFGLRRVKAARVNRALTPTQSKANP